MSGRWSQAGARKVASLLIALTLAWALSGCAGASSTAEELYGTVTQISQRAADEDYAGALAELDSLDEQVATALNQETIDAEQAEEISAASALVRSDLETVLAIATPSPSPEPTEAADSEPAGDSTSSDGGSSSGGNSGGGNSGGGNGNSGNGNGNSNGNGNGGNNGKGKGSD